LYKIPTSQATGHRYFDAATLFTTPSGIYGLDGVASLSDGTVVIVSLSGAMEN
jgi:hypothetical protein